MSRLRDLAEALKLEHTIFALPFAYLGLWVASKGSPTLHAILWVTLAMVGARTLGMAVNRLADFSIDRLNPRTRNWPVPAGRVKRSVLGWLACLAGGLLFFSAWQLNPLCLKLAPLAMALSILYPYTKRFTWTCHFWLGAVLACAPAGGWLAASGVWANEIWPLALGVFFWVAGFDILYALLDIDFDRAHNVYSIPQRFGIKPALAFSSLCHVLAIIGFGWFGGLVQAGPWYWIGWMGVAGMLGYEHWLVSPNRLDRIQQAFFTVNGWVSVGLFVFTILDLRV
jgi:4-hydroxybenzoate polyprenyltransferase